MEPILCVKDCGFFGTAENRNMCSKCYKDFLKSCSENENVAKITQKLDGMAVKEEEKKKKNRCKSCNKKVGLLGFACRCGELFCGLHRLPEGHACDFDYKSSNRSNPGLVEVKADKLDHRI